MASVSEKILKALPAIENGLTKPDFDAVASGFRFIAGQVTPLSLQGIDGIVDFDARTHLFTALMRMGRISPTEDAALEKARKDALCAAGEVWVALGDMTRGDAVMEAAGKPDRAIATLERQGLWREAADKAKSAGLMKMAAQILQAHDQISEALDLYISLGEATDRTLRLAVSTKDTARAKSLAKFMTYASAKRILFQGGMAPLALELAAEANNWREVARIYAHAGQYADAAQALRRAGDLSGAIAQYRRGGLKAEAQALVSSEAERLLQAGNTKGAGEFLRHHGMATEAVELIRESDPELAFAWLQQGGLRDRARQLAAEMAGRLDAKGEKDTFAAWLEKSGQYARAAGVWLELNRLDEAMHAYEEAKAWEKALAIAVDKALWPKIQSICARGNLPIPEGVRPKKYKSRRHRKPVNPQSALESEEASSVSETTLDDTATSSSKAGAEGASEGNAGESVKGEGQ